MPRLSRHEASLVIALFRDPAAQESGPARRLLQRLENALTQSIDAVREQRRRASAIRQSGKTARSKINVRPDAKEEDQCQIPSR
jgi:hypothetical protein